MIIVGGMTMMIPAAVDWALRDEASAQAFAAAAGISTAVGSLLFLLCRSPRQSFKTKEMFLTTTLTWVFYALFAALPFYLSLPALSFTDAFFEAMSGLTATGATIFADVEALSAGLLLWRSLIQWLGGAGIAIVAISIFPMLRIGGMQFFSTESAERSERDVPTVAQNMHFILGYFCLLSAACMLCLWAGGMSLFDAVNHAMTCIATGGFSTHNASVGFFQSPLLEWILIVFMTLAGLPLVLGLHLATRQWSSIRESAQIKTYFSFLAGAIVLFGAVRYFQDGGAQPVADIVRLSAFNVVSVVSSTTFLAEDFTALGPFFATVFLLLMTVGGCTGSTSGGIKMFRFTILFQTIKAHIKSLVRPHGVFVPRYGKRAITDEVMISVLVFFGLFFGGIFITALLLTLSGLDFVSGLSGAIGAIANTGIGLGDTLGPYQSLGELSTPVKWILLAGMLLGRLEFITVLVLFFPFLWRKNI